MRVGIHGEGTTQVQGSMRQVATGVTHRFIAAGLIASLCLAQTSLLAQAGELTCASRDGSYQYCRADTRNFVQLTRQLPGARCQQDYSWGYDYRGIWVDRGCRAQFSFGRTEKGSGVGTAVAAGILGAIVLGAIASHSSSDDHNDASIRPRDYRNDAVIIGFTPWTGGRAFEVWGNIHGNVSTSEVETSI